MGRDKELIALFVAEFSAWVGVEYSVTSWPDVQTRDRQAVDAIAEDRNGLAVAIEHTLLQPFAGDRADQVPFLKTVGRLDQRQDLAEPNWMIDLIFKVGAIPTGVDWLRVAQRIEGWFVAIRPTLGPGRSVHEVDQLPFSLTVTVHKSVLPGTSGRIFVARHMPEESVESVLREAMGSKLPKLAATPAAERILLLEMDSPARGYWEIGETIETIRGDFSYMSALSSAWIARTVAWESEGYIGFHLVWPLTRAIEHQEWYKARKALHPTA